MFHNRDIVASSDLHLKRFSSLSSWWLTICCSPKKYWNITQGIQLKSRTSSKKVISSMTFQRKTESFFFFGFWYALSSFANLSRLIAVVVVCDIMRCLIWMYKRHLSCIWYQKSFMLAYITRAELLLHSECLLMKLIQSIFKVRKGSKHEWICLELNRAEPSNQKRAREKTKTNWKCMSGWRQ